MFTLRASRSFAPPFLILILAAFLTACSSSELSTSAFVDTRDTVAVEQYKPGIPYVEAEDLTDSELAEVEADDNTMVLQEYTFSDGSTYEYETVGDWVVEGDMLLSTVKEFEDDLEEEDARIASGQPTLTAQGAFLSGFNKWPNGVIRFELASLDNFNSTQKQAIQNAQQEITNKTDVGFLPDNGGNRIRYTNDNSLGCVSRFGMVGGVQILNLADNCFTTVDNLNTILHELGHAAGLMHEHQRSDRGTRLDPNEANLTLGMQQVAQTQPVGPRTAYDYLSNIHYERSTSDRRFVKDPTKPMFFTPGYSGDVRSTRLSTRDIQAYNLVY